MKIIQIICRTLVGLVFTFSGFVKAVDPLGSAYKFTDYFASMHLSWLSGLAFTFSILLSGLEFLVGFTLLFNVKTKLASWGAALFMLIFTPVTLWIAIANPVHDCGCFGDALVISNWATFYKNIVIDVMVVILFLNFKNVKTWLSKFGEIGFVAGAAILILGFEIYNFRHLPVIDFRPYKIGSNIPDKMKIPEGAPHDSVSIYFILKNLQSNQEKEVNQTDYMKDSSYWNPKKWAMVKRNDKLISKGYEAPIHDLTITSVEPQEITGYTENQNILQDILTNPDYNFWLVAYSLPKSNLDGLKNAGEIAKFAAGNKLKFYALTSSGIDLITDVKKKLQLKYSFFNVDETTLKTMIRANPGLMLLKNGTVVKMWHYNDFPTNEELSKLISNK